MLQYNIYFLTVDIAGGSKEAARQLREEKKAQRQKEMEQKRAARQAHGAMKLGAKKLPQFWCRVSAEFVNSWDWLS